MADALAVGSLFGGRYEVQRALSKGGMGVVYEVVHLETRRRRALKVMLPELSEDAELRRRFREEACVTAEIESEHLVETFDAGIDPGSGAPFLVMELLKGEDLAQRLDRGPLSPAETVALLEQAAKGLDTTHERGIVHRDLKPDNLFVTKRPDGSPLLKILDFGVAKVVARAAAKSTRTVGTPLYMAPEQANAPRSIGPATDRYALGQIAFTLLVGQPFWGLESEEADSLMALLAHISRGAPEPASARAQRFGIALGAAFDSWFARATHVDPAVRFASATEQIAGLASALEGHSTSAVRVESVESVESVHEAATLAASAATPGMVAPTQIAAGPGAHAVRSEVAVVVQSRPGRGPRYGVAAAAIGVVVVAAAVGGWIATGGPKNEATGPASDGLPSAAGPQQPPSSSTTASAPPAAPAVDAGSGPVAALPAPSASALPRPIGPAKPPPGSQPRPPSVDCVAEPWRCR